MLEIASDATGLFLETITLSDKTLEGHAGYRSNHQALPIRYITVPQTGHSPLVAGFPFFMVTSLGLAISRFSLHLTQYA